MGNAICGTAIAAIPVVTTNTQPVTAVDVVGSQVTFTAAFSGAGPIAYQWQVIGGGATNNIAGATNTTLTLTNLQITNTAAYRLQASNASGVASSAASSLTVNPVPAAVNNIITSFAAQTGLGSSLTNFTTTWTVAPGSLIAGDSPSSVGSGNFSDPGKCCAGVVAVLTDGTFGWLNYWPNVGHSSNQVTCGTVASGAGQSVTYTLTGSANGYNLTNITVYGGWGDGGRDQQAYTIYYSTVAAPANFIELTSVNYLPSNPAGVQCATRATIVSTNVPLATNVAAVEFNFTSPVGENGYEGYSEIQLFGTPPGALPVVNLPVCSPNSPVDAGTLVTFSETASGAAPLLYQWQSDNGSGGASYTDIAGATATNYLLNTTNFGNFTLNFRVRVTDPNGSTTSPSLQLVVTNTNNALSASTLGNLRCEHVQNPLGIDVRQPRLSWVMNSTQRGDHQTAYQILVASSPAILAQNQGDLWNSGAIVSSQSVLVSYAGQPLVSGEPCYWQARIWDQNGNPSAWSPSAIWSMGLLNASDWTAQWIGMNENTNISPSPPSPMLRTTFDVTKTVSRATAYICGLGYYELQLNGAKVCDHVLDPTWTRYDLHADYVTYDVTTNLIQGENGIGVQLANGYYNQWTQDAWNTYTAPWRALPELLLQLDIQYTDGTSNVVVSGSSWKASTGPMLLDTTRLGEVYDARLEKPGWSTAGYNDSAWSNVVVRQGIAGSLFAPDAEPIKVFQTVTPVQIIPVSGQPGVYTFDFGQNLVGWGQLSVSGPAGTSVSMIYGEKTNSDGSVNQNNINYLVTLTQYFQTDTYILDGDGVETWHPSFTYHGFRYAQVTGLPAAPTTNTLVAQVVHTDFDTAGSFLCANNLLNRIETNTQWTYCNDFVGIPTDCPTREKNGWDGDAQLACEVGLTHYHTEAAYTRWLKEFGPAQMSSGELSGVFPNAIWGYGEGPAWESAVLLIPWFVYQHCGDIGILSNNYAAMKAYVNYETSVASGNIVSYGLGDWEPANTVTPVGVTDTGYYYQGALIIAQTAALMGNTADSVTYSNLAAQIYASFNSSFFNSTNDQYSGGTQTAQSCALYQGLVPTNQIYAVASALASSVQSNGNIIDTGILGSKYLLRALCDNGQAGTAFALATQTLYPSWGWQVDSGATTLWETWCGCGSEDSLDHIMFGDISAWFMEYVAGIRPGAPGYKTVIIKPDVMNGLAWAQATHDSPYGMISNAWQINGLSASMTTVIPPGATALVYLPMLGTTMSNVVIQESGTTIWQNGAAAGNDPGVVFRDFEGFAPQTYSVWMVPSGTYQFAWQILVQPPGGLLATAGNEQVSLSWGAVAGASGYNVKRSTTSGGNYTTVASSSGNSYTDTGLVNGTTYYYEVSAVSAGGESSNSSAVSATPSYSVNFSFEIPSIGSGNYQYNPSGGFWTFNGASPNGSGIVANGSAFSNPNAPDGVQAAFVQEYGSVSQTLSGFTPGSNYTISYLAAERPGYNQTWNITIDGTVIASYAPGSSATSYVNYTATFTATAPTETLAFVGTDLEGGDNTIFIDNLQIVEGAFVSVPNFGFEIPSISNYEYDPSGASWTFGGSSPNGSGIVANGSGFSNPNAPQGVQAAFVQEDGTIAQTITGFTPGTNYTLTFSAAQRSGANQHGGESWNVLIDGNVIASFNPGPNATTFVDYTAGFTASAGSETLEFAGTDLAGGDNTVFIDNVSISQPIQPQSASVDVTSPANNASFSAPSTINFAATVVTNGNVINNVQFYANATTLIGQAVAPPYMCIWSNVPAGNYAVLARVNFNGGRYADSAAANIIVSNPPPVIAGITFEVGGQVLSIMGTGLGGQPYVLDVTTSLSLPATWTPLLTNLSDASGNISFTNLPHTNTELFYRISGP